MDNIENEKNDNFYWIADDINKCLILKVFVDEDIYIFDAADLLQVTGDELDVKFANIYDMTDLLTIGIVRFASINDDSKRIDIPFRNLHILFKEAASLDNTSMETSIISDDMVEGFSVNGDMKIMPLLIDKPSLDLVSIMELANNFGNLDMDDKFKALTDMNDLNYKRMKERRMMEEFK